MTIHKNGLTALRCTALAKADLHVHAMSRTIPIQRRKDSSGRGASSIINRIIGEAQVRGMRFATITEHNSMALSLLLKHLRPDEAFTGVEITTLFPEDGGRAHVLAYGIEEAEFKEIQRVRKDIYDFRDYMKERHIAYSVAHAVHSVEIKDLNVDHLEKLLLLFDVFEIVNGGCSHGSNHIWANLLKGLTPDCIEKLLKKHAISPISEDPWIKGFTGGSDDHGEGAIGNSYTVAPAQSVDDFLGYLRSKLTFVGESCGPTRKQGGQTAPTPPDSPDADDSTISRLWPDMFESVGPHTEAA